MARLVARFVAELRPLRLAYRLPLESPPVEPVLPSLELGLSFRAQPSPLLALAAAMLRTCRKSGGSPDSHSRNERSAKFFPRRSVFPASFPTNPVLNRLR